MKICHQRWVRSSTLLFKSRTLIVSIGSLDTTVRLKYTLTIHPTLTTATSLSTLLSRFGHTDTDTIRILLKPPKRAPEKFATAVVEFKQIGDAFAAVCASGRADRGLAGVQIDWAEGAEPQILGWLKKRGVLSGLDASVGKRQDKTPVNKQTTKAQLPQMQNKSESSAFSSFPDTLVSATEFARYNYLTTSFWTLTVRLCGFFHVSIQFASYTRDRLRVPHPFAIAAGREDQDGAGDQGTGRRIARVSRWTLSRPWSPNTLVRCTRAHTACRVSCTS
jgi:hypothetical protein